MTVAGTFEHVPVLADAVLEGLAPLAALLAERPGGGVLIDCTLGGAVGAVGRDRRSAPPATRLCRSTVC